jgi:hypothetical protein
VLRTVRPTDLTLSCAARTRVPKPMRHATRLHVRCAMRVACRRPSCAARAGSAGGPKPGRVSFYGELGGDSRRLSLRSSRSNSLLARLNAKKGRNEGESHLSRDAKFA